MLVLVCQTQNFGVARVIKTLKSAARVYRRIKSIASHIHKTNLNVKCEFLGFEAACICVKDIERARQRPNVPEEF